MSYKSSYTGAQIDAGVANANTAVQPNSDAILGAVTTSSDNQVINYGGPKDRLFRKLYHKDASDWTTIASFTYNGSGVLFGGGFIEGNIGSYQAGMGLSGATFSRWYYEVSNSIASVSKVGTDVTAGSAPPQFRLTVDGNIIHAQVAGYNTATEQFMTVVVNANLVTGYQSSMTWTIT